MHLTSMCTCSCIAATLCSVRERLQLWFNQKPGFLLLQQHDTACQLQACNRSAMIPCCL
jgi:hypothetical protein